MWQTSDIYAEANSELLVEFLCSNIFGRETYLVRNADGHPWHVDDVKHRMPENGLIVVRNLNFQNDENTDESIEDEVEDEIIWDSEFVALNVPNIINSSRIIETGLFEFEVETFPPNNFLQYLKSLHLRTGATIAYYFHQTWGGNTDIEYAWVFANEEEVLVFKDHNNSYRFTEQKNTVISEGVLKRMLELLALELPTDYFALHAGSFGWEKWRVRRDGPTNSEEVRQEQ